RKEADISGCAQFHLLTSVATTDRSELAHSAALNIQRSVFDVRCSMFPLHPPPFPAATSHRCVARSPSAPSAKSQVMLDCSKRRWLSACHSPHCPLAQI